jgi:hypothetical protein
MAERADYEAERLADQIVGVAGLPVKQTPGFVEARGEDSPKVRRR